MEPQVQEEIVITTFTSEIHKEIRFLKERIEYDQKRIQYLESLLKEEDDEHTVEEIIESVVEVREQETKLKQKPNICKQEEKEEGNEEKSGFRKGNPCLYCGKILSHISKHISDIHKQEAEVKAILSIDIDNEKTRKENLKKRRAMWMKLIRKGRVNYNVQKREKIIPKYQKKTFENKDALKPCPYCMDLYYRVRRHMKICEKRDPEYSKETIKSRLRFFK